MSQRGIALIFSRSLVLVVLLCRSPAFGEPQAGAMEVRGTIGYSNFLDEGPLHHLITGGSARFYVTKRLAVVPEFLFMYRSSRDIDFQVIPNLASTSQNGNRGFSLTRLEVWVSNATGS